MKKLLCKLLAVSMLMSISVMSVSANTVINKGDYEISNIMSENYKVYASSMGKPVKTYYANSPVEIKITNDNILNFSVEKMEVKNNTWQFSGDTLELTSGGLVENSSGWSNYEIGSTINITDAGVYSLYIVKDSVTPERTTIVIDDLNIYKETTAAYANSSIYSFVVDGQVIELEAFNIAEKNYIKLRDVAEMLKGTDKEFSVNWSEPYINVISGEEYISTGNEFARFSNGDQIAVKTNAITLKDGEILAAGAYEINDTNYFSIRDLGKIFNFDVYADKYTVYINTESAYFG